MSLGVLDLLSSSQDIEQKERRAGMESEWDSTKRVMIREPGWIKEDGYSL